MNGEITLTVKTESFEYSLKFDRNVTFIRGDSGTGKTYFCDLVYQALSGDRGVSLECDRDISIEVMPVDTLTGRFNVPWYKRFKNSNDTLFIIDEECDCLKGKPQNLSDVIKHTSNYYVIVSRKTFSDIPYSVHSIYELKVDEGVSFSNVVIRNQRMYHNLASEITPSLIVTEDSGAGYLFFSKATNIPVQSAKSKTRINKVLIGLLNQHKDNILVIVDGAAFGPEIEMTKQKIGNSAASVALYMPESFEWLMLNSLQFGNNAAVQLRLMDYLNLIDYTKFFSVEQYFTSAFKEACEELGYSYNKSEQSLPVMLLSQDNISHLLKMIPNVEFSTKGN